MSIREDSVAASRKKHCAILIENIADMSLLLWYKGAN